MDVLLLQLLIHVLLIFFPSVACLLIFLVMFLLSIIFQFIFFITVSGFGFCFLKKYLPFPRSQRYSPTFSSVSFMVVNFMFRSMNHLKNLEGKKLDSS